VAWDQYFFSKRVNSTNADNDGRKGWLGALLSHREFRWAIWVLLITLLVYVLLEMRRKQRLIPVIARPTNDSLNFVKTIGRLYFDKGDHRNLSKKMAAYFLEHVRNRYKLATGKLDEVFVRNLQFKTGLEEEQLRALVHLVQLAETAPVISDKQLIEFHKQLENFYSNT
jgi:hypothetical protein